MTCKPTCLLHCTVSSLRAYYIRLTLGSPGPSKVPGPWQVIRKYSLKEMEGWLVPCLRTRRREDVANRYSPSHKLSSWLWCLTRTSERDLEQETESWCAHATWAGQNWLRVGESRDPAFVSWVDVFNTDKQLLKIFKWRKKTNTLCSTSKLQEVQGCCRWARGRAEVSGKVTTQAWPLQILAKTPK